MDKKKKNLTKLKKLLAHWAEHNDSHKESFLKWKDIAAEYELDDIVEKLEAAIKMMDNCTSSLLDAEKLLEY